MKLTLLLSVTGLLATGLVTQNPTEVATSSGEESATPLVLLCSGRLESELGKEELFPVGKMQVSKKVLYLGDTVDLQFSTPHGANLAIKDPDGRFFYVVFPSTGSAPKLVPLVESKKFVRLNSLQIRTDKLKADPYTYGVEENQPVFTKSGTYTLIMGHDLHVDDESELEIVKIKYYHQKNRPAASKIVDIAAN